MKRRIQILSASPADNCSISDEMHTTRPLEHKNGRPVAAANQKEQSNHKNPDDRRSALLQAAKASMFDSSRSFEEADSDLALEEAMKSYGDNDEDPEIETLRPQLIRRKRSYKKKTKAMFRNMRKSLL